MQPLVALLAFGAKAQWRLAYTGSGPGLSLGSGSGPLAASRSAVAPENPAVARGGSRFFLDTADVAEWEALLPLGMFHGVTTNPTLLERAGVACTVDACRQLAGTAAALGVEEIMFQAWISPKSPRYLPEISQRCPRYIPEIIFQAWGENTAAMVDTGLRLASIEPARVTVKVPVTAPGLTLTLTLTQP